MNFRKGFTKAVKWGTGICIGVYAAAYLGLTAIVHYDYYTRDQTAFAEDQQTLLKVRRFKVNIDNKDKYITFAGEAHYYNRGEYEIAQRLVDEHPSVAFESFRRDKLNLENKVFMDLLRVVSYPNNYFFLLGTGRTYDNILLIARDKGYKIIELEKDQNRVISDTFPYLPGRVKLLMRQSFLSLIGPLQYPNARFNERMTKLIVESRGIESFISVEERLNKEGYYFPDREKAIESRLLLAERDKEIAKGVTGVIRRNDIDKLLVGVGLGHLDGVVWYLSKELELKEIKEK